MANPWMVIAAVIGIGLVYVLVPHVSHTYARFKARRALRCPETGRPVEVGVDAGRAAVASAFGEPALRVKECTLWPEKSNCRQECVGAPEMR